MARIPQPGDVLNEGDVEMLVEAIEERQDKHPDEPALLSIALVMTGIGTRFRKLTCQEEEWVGYLSELPETDGIAKCPNGHTLSKGPALRLTWMLEE